MASGLKKRGEVWYSNLVIPRSGGKRHVEALSRDMGEAKRLCKQIAVTLESTNPRSTARAGAEMSIEVFTQKVIAHYRTSAGSTRQVVERSLRNLVEALPIKKVGDITPEALKALRLHWIRTGRVKGDVNDKPTDKKNVSVVNREIRQLISIMKWAEDEEGIKLPIQNWRPVRKTQLQEIKNRTLTYTREQHDKLRCAATGPMLTAYMLAYHAGLRRSEIRHLRREDVDLSFGRIHVRAKDWTDPVTGKHHEWFPKGSGNQRQRDRMVPIEDGPLRVYLSALFEKMPGEWVLSDDMGLPFSVNTMSEYWSRIVLSSGVGVGSLHTLRHCFATELISRGEPVPNVQAFLGHSSLDMTMNVYNHFVPTQFATRPKEA